MKIKNQILYLVAILSVTFLTFSCSETSEDVARLPSIVDIAKSDPNFSILVEAVVKTGLATTLSNPGSYTVFAPTNDAFNKAGIKSGDITAMTDATAIANLRVVVLNHVLGIGTRSSDLLAGGYFKTFGFYRSTPTSTSGANISMYISKPAADVLVNGGVSNGGAKVTKADIDASNGIVHVIDGVLAIPTIVQHAVANPSLSSLVGVVTSPAQSSVLATLTAATGAAPVTVYAPTNAAFTKALGTGGYLVGKTDADITKILNYHLEKFNRVTSSATAFSTTADITVTTLFPTYTFVITRGTLKIVDKSTPAVNANATVLNIQGANGSIQIVDKVLQSL
ncbi:fasciclin domain-containing protein [Flavobacterium nackdongense]|uniref:Fasciclin domain-containing protein n=1 Tax=Flavobacterium nackdongense TaxID=2547394 RepID=A0A4V1AGW4_9FLAO|nr:fasciclin domain-containing protein [Flavobacterium nackdongense]QBN19452.1 fasciclin domain-containing protein [Flavobacterium nackdongense]